MPDSASVVPFASIQPVGPPSTDPTNVLTRYLLEHPLMASATLSHQDTATILYLSPALELELLSVPVQAVPPAPGGQQLVGVVGVAAAPGVPIAIRTLPAASSYALFAADFTRTDQGGMAFEYFFVLTEGGVPVATDDSCENRVGLFPTVVPLPYGHYVVPGPLMKDAPFAATHQFLGLWGKALRARVVSGGASMDMAK